MQDGNHDEYARFARLYDPLIGPLLAEVRLELAALALRLRARSVLDICCGTGAQLAPMHRAGLACVGVDLSEAMLAVARRSTPAAIRYLRCDAAALPVAQASFDLAVITFALHEKPHFVREAMLAEALRVLRPGGALAVADYGAAAGPAARLGLAAASVVERMAGREHFSLFRDYLERGGTQGALEASGLRHDEVKRTHLGGIVLATVRKPRA